MVTVQPCAAFDSCPRVGIERESKSSRRHIRQRCVAIRHAQKQAYFLSNTLFASRWQPQSGMNAQACEFTPTCDCNSDRVVEFNYGFSAPLTDDGRGIGFAVDQQQHNETAVGRRKVLQETCQSEALPAVAMIDTTQVTFVRCERRFLTET